MTDEDTGNLPAAVTKNGLLRHNETVYSGWLSCRGPIYRNSYYQFAIKMSGWYD